MGPSTLPCGTPHRTSDTADSPPAKLTVCERFVMNDSIESKTLPRTPKADCRRSNIIGWCGRQCQTPLTGQEEPVMTLGHRHMPEVISVSKFLVAIFSVCAKLCSKMCQPNCGRTTEIKNDGRHHRKFTFAVYLGHMTCFWY